MNKFNFVLSNIQKKNVFKVLTIKNWQCECREIPTYFTVAKLSKCGKILKLTSSNFDADSSSSSSGDCDSSSSDSSSTCNSKEKGGKGNQPALDSRGFIDDSSEIKNLRKPTGYISVDNSNNNGDSNDSSSSSESDSNSNNDQSENTKHERCSSRTSSSSSNSSSTSTTTSSSSSSGQDDEQNIEELEMAQIVLVNCEKKVITIPGSWDVKYYLAVILDGITYILKLKNDKLFFIDGSICKNSVYCKIPKDSNLKTNDVQTNNVLFVNEKKLKNIIPQLSCSKSYLSVPFCSKSDNQETNINISQVILGPKCIPNTNGRKCNMDNGCGSICGCPPGFKCNMITGDCEPIIVPIVETNCNNTLFAFLGISLLLILFIIFIAFVIYYYRCQRQQCK